MNTTDPTPSPEVLAEPEALSPERRARWGQERRLQFIDFRLRWDGGMNRADLTNFFGTSVPQASLDIARYHELAPGNLEYDRKSRVYVASPTFRPVFTSTSPSGYLNELLAQSTGVLDAEASFIGWRPPVDTVPIPSRHLNADKLAAILKAIRERAVLSIDYQSMTRPELTVRTIAPHALAHDGQRWHVRAYCHTREKFLDFVIARMLRVEAAAASHVDALTDLEWHNVLRLVLVPHPDLSPANRRAIELDYDMRNGQTELQCRQALLFYTLRRLGLGSQVEPTPQTQPIVLENGAELEEYMPPATEGDR